MDRGETVTGICKPHFFRSRRWQADDSQGNRVDFVYCGYRRSFRVELVFPETVADSGPAPTP